MNDRFKFRMWDGFANKMLMKKPTPLYENVYECVKQQIFYESKNPAYGRLAYNHNKDGRIFEQCTGVKDKNGKLIFEGDIVKTEWFDEKTIYQVVWDEKMACFCFEGKNIFYLFDDLPADVTEIIGNIHENPELLEM